MEIPENVELNSAENILLYSLCCCYVVPQCLCTGLHSQTISFSSQVGSHLEQQSLCPEVSVGQDRFSGFHIMSQFHIAELASRGTVQEVPGSSPQQLAYHIGPAFNFRINTRSAYPRGLPEEFAFAAELRMRGGTVRASWNVWQMQDAKGGEQLAVGLDGGAETLELTLPAPDAGSQTAVFGPLPSLFNDRWHRVLLEVRRRSVTLVVDCVPVGARDVSPRRRVSPDGFTLIGKRRDHPGTAAPFELQSMLIHCDVTRAREEACQLPANTQCGPAPRHPPSNPFL
ncbi:collagen alpha-1(XIX) chain [Aulostomus maculatus]